VIDWEGMAWLTAVFLALIGLPVALVIWKGLRPIRVILGLIPINDEIEHKVRANVTKRCSEASVLNLGELVAEEHLRQIAIEAIVEAYNEHCAPKAFTRSENWPDAKVVINGDIAVIRPWLGHDYDTDSAGTKAINVRVILEPQLHDFNKAKGAVRASAARAAQAFEIPNGQPDAGLKRPKLQLTKPAQPAVKPIPPGVRATLNKPRP
jgi:hypothetical protein